MISVENISVFFGERILFDEINFTIQSTDRIGLVGRNGAGKSTLLKIILGEQQPDDGRVSRANQTTIGYLPQELHVDYNKSVYEEACVAFEEVNALERKMDALQELINQTTDHESEAFNKILHDMADLQELHHHLGGYQQREEVEKILKGLGFVQSDFDKPVTEFSGGWQMRIELGKILLKQPDFMLLDEPTNHLDIESIIWLEGFLKTYPGGILLISHDQRFLDNVTNRTIEIVSGDIFDYNCSYTKFLELREIRREQQSNEAKRQEKMIEHTEMLISKFRAKASKAKFAQSLITKLEKVERIEIDNVDTKSIKFNFPPAPRSGQVVVSARHIDKRYDNLHVLDNIDFTLERGEKVAFVGKNGEGKSTFSRMIAGKDRQYKGELELGHNVSIGYYEQNQAEALDGDITVFDTLDQIAVGDMRTRVRSLLGAFLFSGDDQDKKVKVLSGGEKGRLALAKLLLTPVNLLILDEPTNHLDIVSKNILKESILRFDGTVIVVSHDREFLTGLTNKVIEFRARKTKEYLGDIQYFLTTRNISSLDQLSLKSSLKQEIPAETEKKTPISGAELKELDKEIKKWQNKAKKHETNIGEWEVKLKEYETQMADTRFYMDNKNAPALIRDYSALKEKTEAEYALWESALAEIEQMEKKR